MTDRRTFISSVASSILAIPLGAFAQPQGRIWRIGFLYFGSRQSALDTGRYSAFAQGMRELGYVDGKNVIIEARFGDGKAEALPGLAAELVRSKVDVIVATGTVTYRALQHATTTIPVVITVTNDPLTPGLAASLSRPGGNFTGLVDTAADLGPKQLELMMAVVPKISRIGVLLNPDNVSHPTQMTRLMLESQKVAIQLVLAEGGTPADIETAFASLAQYRADAVILFNDTLFTQQLHQIAQAALDRRVPSIYGIHEFAKVGGLMSYGPIYSTTFGARRFTSTKFLRAPTQPNWRSSNLRDTLSPSILKQPRRSTSLSPNPCYCARTRWSDDNALRMDRRPFGLHRRRHHLRGSRNLFLIAPTLLRNQTPHNGVLAA